VDLSRHATQNKEVLPDVSTPKPDAECSFSDDAFLDEEIQILQHAHLRNYTQAHPYNYFPFLTFEVKADLTGGSMYHAQNQAAGAGAYAVYSLKSFLNLAHLDTNPLVDHTLFFSCTINPFFADIWIHWCEPDQTESNIDTFRSARIGRYLLEDFEHLQKFKDAISNIRDWAIETRLPVIRTAVSEILRRGGGSWLDLEWLGVDKPGSARSVRKSITVSTRVSDMALHKVVDGRVKKASSEITPAAGMHRAKRARTD